jgi:hypothetical protein
VAHKEARWGEVRRWRIRRRGGSTSSPGGGGSFPGATAGSSSSARRQAAPPRRSQLPLLPSAAVASSQRGSGVRRPDLRAADGSKFYLPPSLSVFCLCGGGGVWRPDGGAGGSGGGGGGRAGGQHAGSAAPSRRGRRWPVGGVRGGPCVIFLFWKILSRAIWGSRHACDESIYFGSRQRALCWPSGAEWALLRVPSRHKMCRVYSSPCRQQLALGKAMDSGSVNTELTIGAKESHAKGRALWENSSLPCVKMFVVRFLSGAR